jgi:hypothetical protein
MTEAIEYNKFPLLTEFFHCYLMAPPKMCGVDQTVSVPMPTEATIAQEALKLGQHNPALQT